MKLALAFGLFLIGMIPIHAAQAAPGVDHRNLGCIRIYKAWQKKPDHKAFAVVTSQSSQGCGGSWGKSSIKAAEEDARKWCRHVSEAGAACVIRDSR